MGSSLVSSRLKNVNFSFITVKNYFARSQGGSQSVGFRHISLMDSHKGEFGGLPLSFNLGALRGLFRREGSSQGG